MALNIKNKEVERLATEVAQMARETKTQAIRRALEERKQRMLSEGVPSADPEQRVREMIEFLEREVWPLIPPEQLGKPISQEEQDEILGYGPHGYCE